MDLEEQPKKDIQGYQLKISKEQTKDRLKTFDKEHFMNNEKLYNYYQ